MLWSGSFSITDFTSSARVVVISGASVLVGYSYILNADCSVVVSADKTRRWTENGDEDDVYFTGDETPKEAFEVEGEDMRLAERRDDPTE